MATIRKLPAAVILILLYLPGLGKPLVFAYVGGYRGNVINEKLIDAKKLTHVLYAFADVYKSKAHLNYPKTDDQNLRKLVSLRKLNPDLRILISVGGLGWSRNFSDMALTENTRTLFAASCLTLVQKYQLDGVDIDWEFPGYPGEGGNKYRPEDKQNYTLLFKSIRERFDAYTRQSGKKLLITTAVDGWGSHFLPHTEMDQVQRYTDYILLMSYNFNTKTQVGGHFTYSPKDWTEEGSAKGSVDAFVQAGMPKNKLVLGIGFFPAAFIMKTTDPLNRYYVSRPKFSGGLYRVRQLTGKNGYKRYWDEEGKSPYLFNATTKWRISYEDEESVIWKCRYINESGIAGLMYWDYFSDPGRKLLNTVNKNL